MVHVPRSSESIPLLVPSDAHARDDARARRGSFAESPGAKSHTLVGTALLCFLGLIMYAAACVKYVADDGRCASVDDFREGSCLRVTEGASFFERGEATLGASRP